MKMFEQKRAVECGNVKCPLNNRCVRFTNRKGVSVYNFSRIGERVACDHFISKK